LVVAASVCVSLAIAPGMYGAEVKFGIEKLGVVYVYLCPNMLVVVCCGTPKVGAEPSMVVRLWKWFTGWAEGLGIEVPFADAPLVCGIGLGETNSVSRRKRINASSVKFFNVPLFYQPTQ
jgi:hypothetical protein